MEKIIKLNDYFDQFQALEITLRGKGAWCNRTGKLNECHYYVCKNEHSNTAVSLCFASVVPMKELHIIDPEQKCLVCACFVDAGEGSKRRQIDIVSALKVVTKDKG